jgi:hypothetical protein
MQILATPNPTLDAYYSALSNYAHLGVTHEQGIRSAFRLVQKANSARIRGELWRTNVP